ncbi:MAG: NADH-quinone oxidoreductase subunit N [Candidatus Paracaedimonas acanthamoebae]|uniref:NADH-quinone oxidoreductase subunit N n=1 Tax=Candidatus Paracaedimonas acanthamoebae TaxID=244581 RepID=A0A8J7PSB4_9PROT|nr:NADH-quinone oxidoreductase subunit N [Candidatus Paracaedimonas acanthamoebae]
MYISTLAEFLSILPECFLTIMVLLMILIGVLKKESSLNITTYILIFSLAVAAYLVSLFPSQPTVSFNNFFIANAYTQFCKIIVILAVVFVVFMSFRHFQNDQLVQFEIPILMLFSTIGMMLMISSNDLISLFLGLELQSLALYILIALPRDQILTTEAGLKYFILGSLSTALFLFGSSLLYALTGTTEFQSLMTAFTEIPMTDPMLIVGITMILSGLAFKISLVPFHMWTPDVYEGSSTSITSFLATAPKVAIFSVVVRLFIQFTEDHYFLWETAFIIFSILSMFLGAFTALFQKNYKRLLAYSTISHMGYILIGALSRNQAGVESILSYFVVYVFTIIGVFACLLNLRRNGKSINTIEEFANLSHEYPLIAAVMAILMFSLAGIPPFAGFFVKMNVFMVAIKSNYILLPLAGMIASVVAAFYYLRIIKIMYFNEAEKTLLSPGLDRYISFETTIVMNMAALIVIFYGLYPQAFLLILQNAAKALF